MHRIFTNTLELPNYWTPDGQASQPRLGTVFREVFRRSNIFKGLNNWYGFVYLCTMAFAISWYVLQLPYITLTAALFSVAWGLFESWQFELIHHRCLAHGAFRFRNKYWLLLFRFLGSPSVPHEVYKFSHLVHHQIADTENDPYVHKWNFWQMFFFDLTQCPLRKDLSREQYNQLRADLCQHLFFTNSYEQYKRWGTIAHPALTILSVGLSITLKAFLFKTLFSSEIAMGYGMALMHGAVWSRFINMPIHSYGVSVKSKLQGQSNASNHWLGIAFSSQWHLNHHNFPRSANSAVNAGQIDLIFQFIKIMNKIGIVQDFVEPQRADRDQALGLQVGQVS